MRDCRYHTLGDEQRGRGQLQVNLTQRDWVQIRIRVCVHSNLGREWWGWSLILERNDMHMRGAAMAGR